MVPYPLSTLSRVLKYGHFFIGYIGVEFRPAHAMKSQGSMGLPHLMVAVKGLGFRVWGLGFGVWGLGFGVWGLGFGVWGEVGPLTFKRAF